MALPVRRAARRPAGPPYTEMAGKPRPKSLWAAAHPEEMHSMGANARRAYEAKYTPEVNFQQLVVIYEAAIQERATS